ncbi:MAG: hypothetical protein KGO53_00565 [Alphaproteobacteria bacterium]|nr:hypothetical protein [Alphaproteobacteria bacterium]
MAANTAPIFSAQGSLQWTAPGLTAANTAMDGTGTVTAVATGNAAGNAAGNFIQKVIARPLGTNAASVLRLFLNNGSTNATAANNALLAEVSLPATTLSQAAAMTGIEVPLNLALPPGYKINAAIGTTVAAGWMLTAVGGQY